MPHPKVKLSDDSGNAVTVTSNRLDVNAYLSATPTIDIGDVSLLLGGTAASTNIGVNTDQTLRVTLALDDVLVGALSQLVKTEDVAHSSGDKGIMALGVRNDGLSTTFGADGDYTPFQVAAEGALYTTHGVTGGADGVTTDNTNGTVLGGDVICQKIDIQAQTDNTGVIAVGFTGVDATIATGTGIILYPGDTYSLEINNLNLIYIESSVNGEGVRYTYFT